MAAITATGLFRLSEPVLECLHLGHAGYRHFALDADGQALERFEDEPDPKLFALG